MNGGIGGQLWLSSSLSVRLTAGGTINSGANNYKEGNFSGAVLVGLGSTANTSGYFGGQVFYSHQDLNVNTYSLGGVLGAQVCPFEHFGIAGEYDLPVVLNKEGTTTVNFGNTSGKLIASFTF